MRALTRSIARRSSASIGLLFVRHPGRFLAMNTCTFGGRFRGLVGLRVEGVRARIRGWSSGLRGVWFLAMNTCTFGERFRG